MENEQMVCPKAQSKMKTSMKCPICGTENDYNWPLQVDGQIKTGGCQDCWEKQSDKGWWKLIVEIDKVLNNETMVTK